MTADGEKDGTGHFHRDGMPDYFEALKAGGDAIDLSADDVDGKRHWVQLRVVRNEIWMAVSPKGPVLKLDPADAEAIGRTLIGFYGDAGGWRPE